MKKFIVTMFYLSQMSSPVTAMGHFPEESITIHLSKREAHLRTLLRTSDTAAHLADMNVHQVIEHAAQFGNEEALEIILNQPELLDNECYCIRYQSLSPLLIAIKNGQLGIVNLILQKWIPYMLQNDHNAGGYIPNFIRHALQVAIDHVKNHPQDRSIVDAFRNNDVVASHLPTQILTILPIS